MGIVKVCCEYHYQSHFYSKIINHLSEKAGTVRQRERAVHINVCIMSSRRFRLMPRGTVLAASRAAVRPASGS